VRPWKPAAPDQLCAGLKSGTRGTPHEVEGAWRACDDRACPRLGNSEAALSGGAWL